MLNRQRGDLAEHAALAHLRRQGLRLVARNFRCKLGEIDLIMTHRSKLQPRVLVFVEVRYRQSTAYGGAAASVTATKRLRIVRTANYFLQTQPKYRSWHSRFDVVAVSGRPEAPGIRWLPAAFDS